MSGNPEAEIRNADYAQLDAGNRGDIDAFMSHFHPEMDVLWFDGRPLIQAPESHAALREPFDRGGKFVSEYQDMKIRVFGDTAISTYNLVGSFKAPDSSSFNMAFRVTSVRIKENGDWKIIHWHESPVQE